MKKVLLITALLLSTPALAEDNGLDCEKVASIAGSIMDIRQHGAPMSEVREKLGKPWYGIITEAYKENRWSTERNKKRAAQDFRTRYELACYEYSDQ